MSLLNWIKKIFQRPEERRQIVETIPPGGRSSIEEPVDILTGMASFMNTFDGISPVVPWDYLEFLIKVAIVNPDISHAVKNWVNLANTGHNIIVEAANDAQVEAVQDRLNRKAFEIYERSGGVDGLINHYLYDLAVTGAISSEDQVENDLSGVKRVVIVPARKIRFQWEDDRYRPYQRLTDGELIPLNEFTYSYYAYQVIENSPYAKPPILAVIEPVLRQQDMFDNIKFMMKKFGLLGLVQLILKAPPQKPNESTEEYRKRLETYASDVMNALAKNFNKGLMVTYEDQELKHFDLSTSAQGANDILVANEEQMASGIGVDSSILGRSYHTTETFANVMYMFMIRDANNYRRLVKRRIEKTYRLDLLLAGIPFETITVAFQDNPARDPQAEAQADDFKLRGVITKVQTGMIDPDTGAQEMGYTQWFDPSKIVGGVPVESSLEKKTGVRRVLQYGRKTNRYEYIRPRIVLHSQRNQNGISEDGKARWHLISDEEVRQVVRRLADKYLKAIRPFIDIQREAALDDIVSFLRRSRFSDFRDEEEFAERIYLFLLERYPNAFSSESARKAITDNVGDIYRYYRLEDLSAWPTPPGISFSMDHIDTRTLIFAENLDQFYLSKFIRNSDTENQLFTFIEEKFLQEGEGLFGRTNEETIQEFKRLLNAELIDLENHAMQRILNTGVQRMRNWAHIGQLAEAGVQYAEVFNPSPEAKICIYMNGKVIPVGLARQAVETFVNMSPAEFEAQLQPVSPEMIEQTGIDEAVKQGFGFPPYHPNCHTRLIASSQELARREVMSVKEVYDWVAGKNAPICDFSERTHISSNGVCTPMYDPF